MKTVLFVATDCSNPARSGYDEAKAWADENGPVDVHIMSHRIGTRTDAHQNQIDIFAYEVCTENAMDLDGNTVVRLQDDGIVSNKDGEILGRMGKFVSRESVVAAVAQGWCTPENKHKEMDTILREAIVTNIVNLW